MTRLARQTFASLSVRNYRLYFIGMLVSATGTWMYQIALGWLVLRLTGSGSQVGMVTGIQFVPMLVAGVWGGVIADRFDKRAILLVTQASMAVIGSGLAVVTLTDVVEVWMLYLASFLLGCATVVDNPTRQSFVTELVGPDRVANAVALNSAMFNAARIVGPALGGVIILVAGIGFCFAYNAVSYVAVLIAVWRMRGDELHRQSKGVARAKGQIRDGLRYVWTTPQLRSTIVLVAIVGTFALNFSVLLPLLARFTFDAGPGTLGVFTSAMGAGSMVGALTVAARSRPSPVLLIGGAAAMGAVMLAIGVAPSLPAAVVLLVLLGATAITFLATANASLQLASSTEMRGRVMSLYLIVFLGSTPLGGPLMGWIAQTTTPQVAFAVGGFAAIVGAALAFGGVSRARRRIAGARSADASELGEPAAA